MLMFVTLPIARRRLAGAERGLCLSQLFLDPFCGWVRATEDSPRGLSQIIERRRALTAIVECGAGVCEEHLRVNPPNLERELITLSKNASRHGHRFAQQRPGFFEAR